MADGPLFAGIEMGGTKIVALVGTGPDHVAARRRIPTTAPDETITAIVEFIGEHTTAGNVVAGGIGSFGPVELRPDHSRYGHILATPKPGWSGVDVLGPLSAAIGAPTVIDTDVGCAALGEARWGAGKGIGTLVYLTVGTGVGGATVVGGEIARDVGHPEMGHLAVPRHRDDDFPGVCRFHGDCLEGMVSGPALAGRWGTPPERLTGSELADAVELVSWYLGAALRSIVYVVAPGRIVVGGGVSNLPGLLPAVRRHLRRELHGYPGLDEHGAGSFVVSPGLGDRAGSLGALALAAAAAGEE